MNRHNGLLEMNLNAFPVPSTGLLPLAPSHKEISGPELGQKVGLCFSHGWGFYIWWFGGAMLKDQSPLPVSATPQEFSVPTNSAARISWSCTWATDNSLQLTSNLTGVFILTTMKQGRQEQPFWLWTAQEKKKKHNIFLLQGPRFWFSLFYGSNSNWH